MKRTLEFTQAVNDHIELLETLGENHPATTMAMMVMMELAPEPLKQELLTKAREFGMLPKPDGYLEDGTPAYCLEDIAKKLGISLKDAQIAMDEFLEASGAAGLDTILIDSSKVHRRH